MNERNAVRRLVLEVSAGGRGARGLFSTDAEPKPVWFENRIVLESENAPVNVRVEVGGKSREFIAFTPDAVYTGSSSGPEQHAGLDFGADSDGGLPHGFYDTFDPDPFLDKSIFRNMAYDFKSLPAESAWHAEVPQVVWDGHPDAEACCARAFEIVGGKIRRPEPGSPFCRNFVYTEFANAVFIWGNCFITMFGKYASHIFPFIEILNNFYRCQAADGFIARQINIADGTSAFERNDPSATGGNIFAWAEWENYRLCGDMDRLRAVFPVLASYHRWLRRKRTWQNGTYFSSGWGCGMDNIPRMDEKGCNPHYDNGHLSFIDVTLQQVLNARMLARIAGEIGEDAADFAAEAEDLTLFVNEFMWDEEAGIYKDLDRHGRLVPTMHVGAFWALLAGVAPRERIERMVKLLEDTAVFNTPCGTASTAVCDPGFVADGGEYWRGGVWCITDYMIVRGLQECGFGEAAFRAARKHVLAVAEVFRITNSIWESYDPTRLLPGSNEGSYVRKEFVGFSGVTPIAMLIEAVIGIRVNKDGIVWDVRLLERHGVRKLRLPDNEITLICGSRSGVDERPDITLTAKRPVSVTVVWAAGRMTVDSSPD